MKKIIFMLFLVSSTVVFAKTEEPKVKIDLPKQEETVLIAKKTIEKLDQNQKAIKILNTQKEGMSDTCIVIY
jgi:hypothetical protein